MTVKADLHGLHPLRHIPGLLCIKDEDNEDRGYAHLIQAHERTQAAVPAGALCQRNTEIQTRLQHTFFFIIPNVPRVSVSQRYT